MGTATRSGSGATAGGYEDAKEKLADAVNEENAAKAGEIYFKAVLASQPNGPAKVPAYLALRHGSVFLVNANQHGVESASKTLAKDVAVGQTATAVSTELVEETSREVAKRGMDEADRAFSDPAERAMSSAMGDIMANGADALAERRNPE